jgi:hypothetical protein
VPTGSTFESPNLKIGTILLSRKKSPMTSRHTTTTTNNNNTGNNGNGNGNGNKLEDNLPFTYDGGMPFIYDDKQDASMRGAYANNGGNGGAGGNGDGNGGGVGPSSSGSFSAASYGYQNYGMMDDLGDDDGV